MTKRLGADDFLMPMKKCSKLLEADSDCPVVDTTSDIYDKLDDSNTTLHRAKVYSQWLVEELALKQREFCWANELSEELDSDMQDMLMSQGQAYEHFLYKQARKNEPGVVALAVKVVGDVLQERFNIVPVVSESFRIEPRLTCLYDPIRSNLNSVIGSAIEEMENADVSFDIIRSSVRTLSPSKQIVRIFANVLAEAIGERAIKLLRMTVYPKEAEVDTDNDPLYEV